MASGKSFEGNSGTTGKCYDDGDMKGEYSIPNCIALLKRLKMSLSLNFLEFDFALELIRDPYNRIILMCLQDRTMEVLLGWIRYKYKLNVRPN